jgi:DNA-binding MarR family transcriptional regulator
MHHKLEPTVETGPDGRLFDPRLRDHLAAAAESNDTVAREALAAMRAASHGLRISMDRWLDRHGVSEGRMGVLWMLTRSGSMSLGDLAAALDVSPTNITGLVDHLERDGLVVRAPDPEDRRAIRASLSPLGQAKLDDIRKEMDSVRETILAGFTDEELKDLRHLCLKLVRNTSVKPTKKELEKV